MARLEVITGPMFSGKSEEMVRRLRLAAFTERKLLLVRPSMDSRLERNIFDMVSEDKKLGGYKKLTKESISSAANLDNLINSLNPDILGIDETQFLIYEFLDVIIRLLNKKRRVNFTIIASGLNLDADARPFGLTPELMVRADEVCLLTAICTRCKRSGALFTQKIGGSAKQIEVGGENIYTARCRRCFVRQSEISLNNP